MNDQSKPTATEILIEIAKAAELFHAPSGTAYADIEIGGHRETYPVESKSFEEWLQREFYGREVRPAPLAPLKAAVSLCVARAKHDKPEMPVFVRCASFDGKIYLDLCDKLWRAVEIDAEGWKIITNPPVRFIRSAGMLSLPEPQRGGEVETLRAFLNFKTEGDFVLAVAWLLTVVTDGPYPILALSGPQGSAKSTAAKLLKMLFDPNAVPLRSLPESDRDLFITANNNHALVFDNVSRIKPNVADSLCRLATGGGLVTRKLYTNDEETLINAKNPIIVNGIEDIIDRPDLADRALFLNLGPIAEADRRDETDFLDEFEQKRPKILGALLDVVPTGLTNLPTIKLEKLPRMADFAKWATACEPALWPEGTFCAAYNENIEEAIGIVIEADPVSLEVKKFVADRTQRTQRTQESETVIWQGTASELLEELTTSAPEPTTKVRSWPPNARALSGRLKRAAPALQAIGIGIEFHRDHSEKGRARLITLSLIKT